MSDGRRVNVNFSEGAWITLQSLAVTTGRPMSRVLRDALALEKLFEDTRASGGRILVETNGSAREVLFR